MDDISTSALFIILGVLILISAYFSSSETGLMAINKYRLKHLENEGHKGAKRVAKLMARPDRTIGLILIGNNLVNIAAASIATILSIRFYGDVLGPLVATIALTLVILIFAEVTPKTMAALYPEKVAYPSSLLLQVLMKVLYPAVWAVNHITNGLLILLRVSPEQREQHSLSSEELRTVVNESAGLLDKHQNMLVNLLDLEKIKAEDIMIPRNEIFALDINADWKDLQKSLTNAQHTRLLLYRDNIDDAVGFIHARDALRLLAKEDFSKTTLLRAVREIYFTPEGTSLYTLLHKLQQNKQRIGLVVDEYGDIQGLFTLEDILEEIVGDFTTGMAVDACDDMEELSDGSFVIDGGASIRDVNKEMGWSLPTDGPKTINGLILEFMEDIPTTGISIQVAGYPIEIVEVKDNKVSQARVYPGATLEILESN